MNERNDDGWFEYTFGMNDESGRLVQIIVPARCEEEARFLVKEMLMTDKYKNTRFWLNDCQPY